jgi:transglutaminase-like putative cysteine protease
MAKEAVPDGGKNRSYLDPTFYLDSDSPGVADFARNAASSGNTDVERAVRLYFAVRDGIRYDPFQIDFRREDFRASAVLKRGTGFCVPKAILLAAAARALGIPSRLRFADVKNHLTTERLRKKMGSDLFIFHGYTELFLEGGWVKATPTFNIDLCRKAGVPPLDFDGRTDAVFHAFDGEGKKYMEYVKDRGTYSDLPYDAIMETYRKHYPLFFEKETGGHRTAAAVKRGGTTP